MGRATSTLRYDTSTLHEFEGSFLPYVASKGRQVGVPHRWLTRLLWEVHGGNGEGAWVQ